MPAGIFREKIPGVCEERVCTDRRSDGIRPPQGQIRIETNLPKWHVHEWPDVNHLSCHCGRQAQEPIRRSGKHLPEDGFRHILEACTGCEFCHPLLFCCLAQDLPEKGCTNGVSGRNILLKVGGSGPAFIGKVDRDTGYTRGDIRRRAGLPKCIPAVQITDNDSREGDITAAACQFHEELQKGLVR